MSEEAGELVVVTTEEKVLAYDLSRLARIGIGRHASNDLQLSSRTVSNFHAELLEENGELFLRDLGSTNGTRVNDERIERSRVSSGDRIRIGNHRLSLQRAKRGDPAASSVAAIGARGFGPGTQGRVLPLSTRIADTPRAVDGGDVALADLLRELCRSALSVVAVIERQGGTARVFVHDGSVLHAEYDEVSGEKALFRLFGWQEAKYSIQTLENPTEVAVSICLPTDTLLAEGVEHAMELGKLVARLPPLASRLCLKEDCPLPLTAHSHAEIEVFQDIIRHGTIENVVARSPYPDVRVLRLVESLLQKRVFEVGATSSVDETHQVTLGAR
jgi:pSer/pThr/pTyr-binding forkhead associated (FHA) protein